MARETTTTNTSTTEEDREVVSEATEFIGEVESASSEERNFMVNDLNFAYSENGQWDQRTLNQRRGRPSYTFNRVLGSINQVIGEQRMFRPSIKLRGVDDGTDKDLAEVMSGLIRNIEAISDAESTYDMAFKFAVSGGYGAWRVVTEFQNDKSFDQEIFIKAIHNPFTVFFDPLAQDPIKRDQTRCVIAERISREFYRKKYGQEGIDILIGRDEKGWITDKGIRIAEYFKLVPVEKELALMSDGRTVPFDDDLKKIQDELEATAKETGEEIPTVEKTRKVSTFQVKWWKIDGQRILEGPITYDWRYIPVVKLPGRYINIEGRQKTQSLIRHAHDAQKTYNYERTTMAETVANAPRQPYLVTAAMIKGYEGDWSKSGSENRPYLRYNPDKSAPSGAQAPQRVPGAEVPQALISMAAQSADDIKHATGFHDQSLGKAGNDQSGAHVKARTRQADVGSFEFFDNLKKAIKFTGDILVDMIPTVYDTERTVRILGLDGEEEFKKINAYDEATDRTLDISQGLYDVRVDIGPAFSTQREESFQTLLEAAQTMPIVAELAPDLIMKNMQAPEGDEIVARIRKKLVAAGVAEPTDEELKDIPPPQEDPVQQALVDSEQASAELDRSKARKTEAETLEIISELPLMLDKLKSDLIRDITQTIGTIRTDNE